MRTSVRAVIVCSVVFSCSLTALAQGTAAQKAAASSSTAILFRTPTSGNVPDAGTWVTVLDTTIKPPGGKDLFIGVSALTEIVNINLNAANGANTFSAATGEIVMRVLVDGVAAAPGNVVFNFQEVATFARLSTQLSNCTEVDVGPNAGKVTCTSTPGLLETIAVNASANSFNFITQDVSPGVVHNIKVQAQFFATVNSPSVASAEAIMLARTLTVESVALDAQ